MINRVISGVGRTSYYFIQLLNDSSGLLAVIRNSSINKLVFTALILSEPETLLRYVEGRAGAPRHSNIGKLPGTCV